MERQFFSGNTIEQAVMAAARHYGLEPERIAYKTRDKKHGFLNIRRRVVIEVDPEAPEKPETPAEEMVEESGEAAAEAREPFEADDRGADLGSDDSDGFDSDGFDSDGIDSDGIDSDGIDSDGFGSGEESRFAELPSRQPPIRRDAPVEERARPPRGRPARARRDDGDDEIWRYRNVLEEKFAAASAAANAATSAAANAAASAEPGVELAAPGNVEEGAGDNAEAEASAKEKKEVAAFEMALGELMDLVEMDLETKVACRDGVFEIDLEGEDGEYLVEREGLLLRSVEHLLPRLVRGFLGYGLPCRVDCNGFQASREAEIREIAGGMAELARRQGKPQKLKPMSPADRRLVHLALADDPTIHTESEGSGYMKRVRVSPV